MELGLRPERQLPRDLWRLDVNLNRVADFGDERRLAAIGLSVPRPVRREWPRSQTVGEQACAEGWRGILAPSAARPEGQILCLFREEETIEGVKPVPPSAIYRRRRLPEFEAGDSTRPHEIPI